MRISFFRNERLRAPFSMTNYANNLIGHLDGLQRCELKTVSIKGWPFACAKDIFLKDVFYPFLAAFKQSDVNHILDHSDGALAYFLNPAKTIVTCHDLIPLEHPRQSSVLGHFRFRYNINGMLKAQWIIAVSEATRNSILKYFKFKGEIRVVYPGVDAAFKKISAQQPDEFCLRNSIDKKRPHLLHVGSSNPSKNFEFVLEVLKNLPDFNLIKVGPVSRNQEALIVKYGLTTRIKRFESIDIKDLVYLYNIAAVLFFPSFCEGFGLPPLEAMACGCPVVCSGQSAMPEIAKDAAVYIDPHSKSDAVEAIKQLANDSMKRSELIAKGFACAKLFSWEKAAKETFAIYEEIMKTNSKC